MVGSYAVRRPKAHCRLRWSFYPQFIRTLQSTLGDMSCSESAQSLRVVSTRQTIPTD